MNITLKDQQYEGANGLPSLYDVIHPHSDAKLPLLIFCHGFKGFKDWGHFPIICDSLAKSGFVVVKLNFSHNGIGSNGGLDFNDLDTFAENNLLLELKDLENLISNLRNNPSVKDIIDFKHLNLIGHSRGGSTAIIFGCENKSIRSITSWAAVADLKDRLPDDAALNQWKEEGVRYVLNGRTGQNMPMNYQYVESLNDSRMNIEKRVKKLGDRLLVIHGENDSSVPLEHAYALQIWNPKARLECIQNADHTFGGRHPFDEVELPKETQEILSLTIDFLKEKN